MCKPSDLLILIIDSDHEIKSIICNELIAVDYERIICADTINDGICALNDNYFDFIFINKEMLLDNLSLNVIFKGVEYNVLKVTYGANSRPIDNLITLVNGGTGELSCLNIKNELANHMSIWATVACLRSETRGMLERGIEQNESRRKVTTREAR